MTDFLISVKNDVKLPQYVKEKAAERYLNGDPVSEILKESGYSRGGFNAFLRKQGIPTRRIGSHKRIHFFNENYFQEIDSPEKAYWLGFIAADGGVCAKGWTLAIGLSRKDEYVLERFLKDINAPSVKIYQIEQVIKEKVYQTSRLALISNVLCKSLEKYGIINKKSLSFCPKNIPEKMIPHFIRGYFDGDGCILEKFNRVDIACSEKMTDWLNNYLLKNGIVACKAPHVSGNIFYSRIQSLENILKFEKLIYPDDNLFSLERKRNIFKRKNRKTRLQILTEEMALIEEIRHSGNFSYEEIAQKTGLSFNRVHFRIKRINKEKK